MAQWINLFRNSIFVNPPPLAMLCEISGPVDLAEPGLTAGRLAGSPSVRPAGRRNTAKSRKLEKSLQIEIIDFSHRLKKVQQDYSSRIAFKSLFSAKACCKGDL